MSLIKHFFPNDEAFSYEVLRAAAYSKHGGGDLAEIINICARIPSGDETKWLQEWQAAAERAEAQATESLRVGNTCSAVDGLLCASNYYRTAEFFRRVNPFEDEISATLYKKSSETFYRAMEINPAVHCEQVKLPYEETHLPAFLLLPAGEHKNLKSIVFNGGYDSTKEEAWFALAAAAVARGYAVLAFDGPGQGAALRDQRLFFRPDWEKVLTPVMDYAVNRPELDASAITVFGWSMGGFLVARAATVEHRAAALVLDDGVYDFGSAFIAKMPGPIHMLIQNGWDNVVDSLIRLKMRTNTGERWGISNGLWTFGLQSPTAFLRATAAYTLEGRCGGIKTQALVLDARDDHFLKGQPQLLCQHLTCKHKLVTLGGVDGGETHCHQGAFQRLHQVIFDWLAENVSSTKT